MASEPGGRTQNQKTLCHEYFRLAAVGAVYRITTTDHQTAWSLSVPGAGCEW